MRLLLFSGFVCISQALGVREADGSSVLSEGVLAVNSGDPKLDVDVELTDLKPPSLVRLAAEADKELDVFFMRHGEGNHNVRKMAIWKERDAALNDVGIAQAISSGLLLHAHSTPEVERFLEVLGSSGVTFAVSHLNRAYTTLLLLLASTELVSSPRINVLEELQEIPPRGFVNKRIVGRYIQQADMAGKKSPHPFQPAASLLKASHENTTESVGSNVRELAKFSNPPPRPGSPTDEEVRSICAKVAGWETTESTYILVQRIRRSLTGKEIDGFNITAPLAEGRRGVADITTAQKLFDLAELDNKKYVFVGGHSEWFRTFMRNMPKEYAISASALGKHLEKAKLKNAEVVRVRLNKNAFDGSIRITDVASVAPGYTRLAE